MNSISMTPEFRDQIVQVIRMYLHGDKNSLNPQQNNVRRNRSFVVLQEALEPSSDVELPRSEISKAKAVWIKQETPTAEGNRVASDEEVDVYNPATDTSYSEGDLGYIEVIGGIPCFIKLGIGSGNDCCDWTHSNQILLSDGTKGKSRLQIPVEKPITVEMTFNGDTYEVGIPAMNYISNYTSSNSGVSGGEEGWNVSSSTLNPLLYAKNLSTGAPGTISGGSVKLFVLYTDSDAAFPHDMSSLICVITASDITEPSGGEGSVEPPPL